MKYRIALVWSLLFLAACATESEQLAQTPSPAEPPPAAAELRDGLAVRYYFGSFNSIRDLRGWMQYKDGRAGSAIQTLNHDMGTGPVLDSGASDLVGAHMTGYLRLEQTGTYRFQVTTNDGVRLHLGGAYLYDDPRTGPARTSEPIPVEITQTGWYPIEIWYFEKRGAAVLRVLWSPPGGSSFVDLPAAAMKHK